MKWKVNIWDGFSNREEVREGSYEQVRNGLAGLPASHLWSIHPFLNRRPFRFTEEGVTVNGKRCFDLQIAEELFGDGLNDAEKATNDRFEQFLTQSEMFGEITTKKYEALVESFINIVIKSCCSKE